VANASVSTCVVLLGPEGAPDSFFGRIDCPHLAGDDDGARFLAGRLFVHQLPPRIALTLLAAPGTTHALSDVDIRVGFVARAEG
jgi:hypothetical protein